MIKITVVISLLMVLIIFFSRCFHDNSFAGNDPRGDQYAGTKACINCHRDIVNSYSHNNHYKTSAAVDNDQLKKLTGLSGGRFYFTDSSYIRMESKDSSVFQSYFINDKSSVSGKFDIAFGSAEKAQTYGYWKEDKLYQLPLTWFAGMKTWANSPGFPASHARFGRVIEGRCFECHASYVDRERAPSGPLSVSEKLNRNSIVYGIDCERCHGPALNHALFQQENPGVKNSRYIVSIKSLGRQQQLDLCAMCHSGNDQAVQRSLFSFMPGDTLSHFYYPDFGAGNAEPDVHGKQLQLLELSQCFKKSSMTCTTCHATHGTEATKTPEYFISKCMSCHQNSTHATGIIKINAQVKSDPTIVRKNCIDCHMPLQTSKVISFNNGAGLTTIPYFIRTHKIALYDSTGVISPAFHRGYPVQR